jgi:hypothetical protein
LPSCPRRIAAWYPPGPAPMTMASTLMVAKILSFVRAGALCPDPSMTTT